MIEVTEIQTTPIVEPVTVAEVKQYLRLDADYDLEDEVINSFIISARQYCEKYTGLSFVPKTLNLSTDKCNIELLYGPVKDVVSVKDDKGTDIDYTRRGGNIFVVDNYPFGYFNDRYPYSAFDDRITQKNVVYTVGYLTLPDQLKTAVKLLAASMYDNRDKGGEVVPMGVISLLAPYSRSGGLFL